MQAKVGKMCRIGDSFVLSDGGQFGKLLWCDPRGDYLIDGDIGCADFFSIATNSRLTTYTYAAKSSEGR